MSEKCPSATDRHRPTTQDRVDLETGDTACIGYDEAAVVARESAKNFESVRDVVKRRGLLSDEQLEEVMNVRGMTEPGIPGGGAG